MRACLTGAAPDDHDRYFEEGGFAAFVYAPAVKLIAEAIIDQRLPWLKEARVLYLWKRHGGSSGGRATLGKCQKLSGLTAYLAQADLAIWIAADLCIEHHLTNYQLEALVFHELTHIAQTDGGWSTRAHDLEAFNDEVKLYGLWKGDIEAMAYVMQPVLFGDPEAAT